MKPIATALTILVAACPAAVHAGVVCMDPDALRAALIDWYGEHPVGPKLERGDSTLQVWASDDGDSWSMIRTYDLSDRRSACVVAQGTGPQSMPSPGHLSAGLLN